MVINKDRSYIMDTKFFTPYVRFFKKRTYCIMPYPRPVLAYDFRLFYVRVGNIEVKLPESTLALSSESLIVIPPATPYQLFFNDQRIEYFVINFDFVHTAALHPPTPPAEAPFFRKEDVICAECPPSFSSPFVAQSLSYANELFNELEAISNCHSESADSVRSALLKYLISKIVLTNEQKKEKNEWIEQIEAYVEENLSEALTIQRVAKAMGYHPNYLNAKFCAITGLTLHLYIENERMKKAKKLLSLTQMPISSVASSCGFSDPSYFTKFFARHQKMSPKEYRKLSM